MCRVLGHAGADIVARGTDGLPNSAVKMQAASDHRSGTTLFLKERKFKFKVSNG